MLPFEQHEFLRGLVESGMSYAETVRRSKLNGIKLSPRTVSNIANCKLKTRKAMEFLSKLAFDLHVLLQ